MEGKGEENMNNENAVILILEKITTAIVKISENQQQFLDVLRAQQSEIARLERALKQAATARYE